VYFVHRGGYAAVALHEDVAVQLTEKQPSLDGKVGRQGRSAAPTVHTG
jgi:hypothetical protein